MEAGEFQNLPPFPLRRVGHPELQTDFKRTAGNYFAAISACAVSLIAGVIRKAGPPALQASSAATANATCTSSPAVVTGVFRSCGLVAHPKDWRWSSY